MADDEQRRGAAASHAPLAAGRGEAFAEDPFPVDPWEQESAPVTSIGEYLKKQRQLRGISQEELCKLTRIPPRSLERLESGTFDTLDDGFVRGFVRTVADALGLDPDDTLARMSAEPPPETSRGLSGPSPGLLRVGILIVGLALVLVSVGLVRTAIDAFPGPAEASPLMLRKDPVRALAEANGVGFENTTQVLIPIPAPARDEDAAREGRGVSGAILRADAEVEVPVQIQVQVEENSEAGNASPPGDPAAP